MLLIFFCFLSFLPLSFYVYLSVSVSLSLSISDLDFARILLSLYLYHISIFFHSIAISLSASPELPKLWGAQKKLSFHTGKETILFLFNFLFFQFFVSFSMYLRTLFINSSQAPVTRLIYQIYQPYRFFGVSKVYEIKRTLQVKDKIICTLFSILPLVLYS